MIFQQMKQQQPPLQLNGDGDLTPNFSIIISEDGQQGKQKQDSPLINQSFTQNDQAGQNLQIQQLDEEFDKDAQGQQTQIQNNSSQPNFDIISVNQVIENENLPNQFQQNIDSPDQLQQELSQQIQPQSIIQHQQQFPADFSQGQNIEGQQEEKKSQNQFHQQPHNSEKANNDKQKEDNLNARQWENQQALLENEDAKIYRKKIIAELIQTEENYISDLQLTVDQFLNPLVKENVITDKEEAAIFMNLKDIIIFNRSFLPVLKSSFTKGQPYEGVFKSSKKLIDGFNIYSRYYNGFEGSVELQKQFESSNKGWEAFMKELRKEGLDLSNYLQKPVQRLPLYEEFYKNLLEHTDSIHSDYNNINEDLKHFKSVNEKINSQLKEENNLNNQVQLQTQQKPSPQTQQKQLIQEIESIQIKFPENQNLQEEFEQEQKKSSRQFLSQINSFHFSKNDKQKEENPNVQFFLGWRRGSNGLKIDELLGKVRDYEYLERRHDYIQWLFPNLFESAFNSSSYCLNDEEVKIMQKDKDEVDSIQIYQHQKISKNYVQGLILFLDFLGLEISYSKKVQINNSQEVSITNTNEDIDIVQITKIDENRLRDALVINTHNHLRIRRVLASLIVLNFKREAKALCLFLRNEQLSKRLYKQIYKYYDENNIETFKKEFVWPQKIEQQSSKWN